ncbi:MAG: hypothetical protein R2755_03655 [Acidimicrobiales bacterium]
MSVPVALDELAETVARFGANGFLMSAGGDGRPRINHVATRCEGNVVHTSIGRGTAAALAERPLVSCLWPAPDGELSLIADGEAAVVAGGEPGPDGRVPATITITWAVLHRPPELPPC